MPSDPPDDVTPKESAGHRADKAMGAMESTLSDLQDEVTVAKEPPQNHFKPAWLFMAIVVFLLVGGGVFFAVTYLTQVPENRDAINKNCELRNQELAAVNEKFQQLNALVEARLRDRPDGSPNPPDVLAAFEALRKPIPLKKCASP